MVGRQVHPDRFDSGILGGLFGQDSGHLVGSGGGGQAGSDRLEQVQAGCDVFEARQAVNLVGEHGGERLGDGRRRPSGCPELSDYRSTYH